MKDGPTAPPKDGGVILVNVLVTLALGAALVVLMLTSQDNMLDRARRVAALAQAQALALGAESSVVIALRRDMAEAPEADHYAEVWAQVQQEQVELGTGRFSVSVQDAQAGLDLNGLVAGGLAPQQTLALLVAALDLPPETAPRIAAAMIRDGRLARISQLTGLDTTTRSALAPYISFLPDGGDVNLNTADTIVIGAVLRNRTAAARLVALRDRNGFVTPDDLRSLGIIATGGAGFRSDVFDVTVTAQVDDVTLMLTSRILRLHGMGLTDVRVIARQFGAGSS